MTDGNQSRGIRYNTTGMILRGLHWWHVVLVNHFLLIDQMVDLANQVHQLVDAVRPVVENLIRIFRGGKVHNANGAIDFGPDSLGNDQCTEGLLCFLQKQNTINKKIQSMEGNWGDIPEDQVPKVRTFSSVKACCSTWPSREYSANK